MRKNVTPSTNEKSTKNNQPFVFESFSRGTIQDPPASEISDALSDSSNLTIYPGFFEGRTGCRLFTGTRFPNIIGRSGYSAHKVGNRVISDSGNIFTEADIGNYWCWGNNYEFIIGYIDAQTVEVETSTYYAGVDCSVMGSINAFFWHKSLKCWVLMIGTEVYAAEWDIPSWNRFYIISRDIPFNAKSDGSEYKDFAFLFNGSGLYKAEVNATYPILYRVNVDQPNIRLQSVEDFTGATCKYGYLYSAARLVRESGIVNRQTLSEIAMETGTNVPDENNIDHNEVFTEHEISSVYPNLVTEFWVPVVPNTDPVEYQWHLTHFPVWRTMNIEAKDPADVNKEKYNDPNRFIWVKDLRICAAFYVMKNGEYIDALRGEFEIDDTHSILELDNGERIEILEWISSTRVRVANDYYYGNDYDGPFAAAIGNGRVIRASVSGDILTRTHGSVFTAADLRKTLWNSEGYSAFITEVVDANNVIIHIDGDLPVQGFTMDPTHRKFYDTIDDATLLARKDFYSCYCRYRTAVPSCNLGAIMPGFVIEAYRGQKTIYYTHLQPKMDYLIGQYVGIQVSEEVQDAIHAFHIFQNIFSVICATSTWGGQIGLSEFTTLPQSNEAIALLPGIKPTDMQRGCMDVGSIQEVENGVIQLITNEPGGEALRQFNGMAYSEENFLVDTTLGGRIVRALEKTRRFSAAIYDGFMGYIFWRKRA
jgi:hypothetical protein